MYPSVPKKALLVNILVITAGHVTMNEWRRCDTSYRQMYGKSSNSQYENFSKSLGFPL